jgi:hypothetical protein
MIEATPYNDDLHRRLVLPGTTDDPTTILWYISARHVDDYCDANDEPLLSKEDLEQLWIILMEDFDTYEIIGEAINCLRNGTRRYGQ